MPLSLRTGEEIKFTANFHWSTYALPSIWAGIFMLSAIVQTASTHQGAPVFFLLIIGFAPLGYKFLQNKCKTYTCTNQRIYVEEGILAKTKRDIPLQKINDLELTQGLVQRITRAGNILVLTGNDRPTRLTNIDNPDLFKNQVTDLLAEYARKAA